MVNHSVHEKGKKKEIAELIRLITAQKELLEPNIPMFVQQLIVNHARGSVDKVASLLTKRIQAESERLFAPFNEVFTHDEIMLLISFYKEIKMLISFYQSEAMRKFSKNGRKLFDPIYDAYREVIEESLNQYKCL